MKIGIIGGSGLYGLSEDSGCREVEINTPFGAPSAKYAISSVGKAEIVFLARHGLLHRIPPHKVNYRANIWGFKELGVERIVTISAVGGISPEATPGSLVMLDQIIDMTGGTRASTFFDGDRVVHIDFTEPYCTEAGTLVVSAAGKADIALRRSGTYVCVNGPRLETAAEIRNFRTMGCDVVGMTAMPEASLAREMELCMTGICVVTNYAAGISHEKLTVTEVKDTMKGSIERLTRLINEIVIEFSRSPIRSCGCKEALSGSEL